MMNKIPELAWHKLHRFEELDDHMKQAIIRLVNYLASQQDYKIPEVDEKMPQLVFLEQYALIIYLIKRKD